MSYLVRGTRALVIRTENIVDVPLPVVVLSDLHVGHPASHIHDPAELAPLFRGAATVIFNGDTVEMLWVHNREKAQRQLEQLAEICMQEGARPIFLNGNHDPVVSSANHLDLFGGTVLVTHGDILFHEIAPWSREAKVLGPEHTRLLQELSAAAHGDFEERLVAVKTTVLALEMHEPRRPGGRLAGLAMAIREGWPPWRVLSIFRCWWRSPGLANHVAETYRPKARFVLIGHTHYAGVWQLGGRIVVNTGSFLPFSGRSGVCIADGQLEVRRIVRDRNEWRFGPAFASFPLATTSRVQD